MRSRATGRSGRSCPGGLGRGAPADAVVRMVVEEVAPGCAQETDRVFKAPGLQSRSFHGVTREGAERFRPQRQLVLALRVALLQVDSRRVHARDQPLLVERTSLASRLAQLADDRLIDLLP